jgi:hypothetical protein
MYQFLRLLFTLVTMFVPFIFNLRKIITHISVFKVPENFDTPCTLDDSAVSFTVYGFKLAASSWCVHKYAVVF